MYVNNLSATLTRQYCFISISFFHFFVAYLDDKMEPVYMQTSSIWLSIYPKGIHDLLLYTKTKYNDPLIYITENGKTLIVSSNLIFIQYSNAALD
jgi:beta-glucosidase/6-phospho-beta-glucosidase/beta-galactosidase